MSLRASKGKSRQLSTWEQLEKSRPLPVWFRLYPSRRTNKALCPCLVVQSGSISIIRILDPEHRQPYISLDSIFLLADKSIPLGILEFGLDREAGDYDLTLAGLEPREGVWVPLKVARDIALELGLMEPLSTLLDWDNRHIWSLDEGEEGLVHNWRALQVDVASYSTGILLQSSIKTIALLPKGQQVRTLISTELRQELQEQAVCMASGPSQSLNSSRVKFEQRLLRWSVLACEELHRSKREQQLRDSASMEGDEDRFQLNTSDLLLLFHDYLTSLEADTFLSSVTLNPEELFEGKQSEMQKSQYLSNEDLYRMARVQVTLLHHLWTLYLGQIASEETTPRTESISLTMAPDLKGKDEMILRMQRLEEHSQRTEISLSELLSHKRCNHIDYNPRAEYLCRLPYLGLTDVRLILGLCVGTILGIVLARAL